MLPFGRLRGGVIAIGLLSCSATALWAVPPRNLLERISPETLVALEEAPLTRATPAQSAFANPMFDAFNVTLLSQVTPQSFSTNSSCTVSATNVCANDVWGYVSPSGREYAILGLRTGTGFVDVTDPINPVVVGAIADANSIWSDMRTYSEYAYNVNESGGGLQVFDLSLIDPPNRQVTLARTVTQSGLSTTHNLTLNPNSRHLYLCGSNLGGGRLVAMSVSTASNPTIVGMMNEAAYVHDAQVVSYTTGPYAGREIAFCFCGSAGLKIVDVTMKTNMFTMATLLYPNVTYCHQGGLSADRRYLFVDDELDEQNRPNVTTTTTYVIDVQNLSSPQYVTSFTSGQPTIDHNLFVRGNYVFEANYTSGLRIFDVTDPLNAVQVGWFDSYMFNNGMSFNGAWGTWPYLPSGVVLVSDMQAGLLVLDPSAAVGGSVCLPAAAPQPASGSTPKNRYLSFVPGDAGKQTAIRVKLVDLPPPFEGFESSDLWVDFPEDIVDTTSPLTTIKRSRLTCEPVFADWGSLGVIRVADDDIVPGGAYAIQQVSAGCNQGVENNYSAAVSVSTASLWGDVVGGGPGTPPNGNTNFVDISVVVDKFKGIVGAAGVDVADLHPSQPDGVIDFNDIAATVDAFKGLGFPFGGPTICP